MRNNNGERSFGYRWFSQSSSEGASWVVSYADLMAILLTFFVLLLAISRVTQTKFDFLVEALTGKKVGNLRVVKERVDEVVEYTGLEGQIYTAIDDDGLRIEFANALLFASASSELTGRGREVFTPIAQHLISDLEPVYGVVVEGYTDDVPIATERFRSNWELSASRAIHVMEQLISSGFNSQRMSVHGFADTRAGDVIDLKNPDDMAQASDAEIQRARAANRRVVLRINRMDKEQLQRIQQNGSANPHGHAGGRGVGTSPAPGDGEASKWQQQSATTQPLAAKPDDLGAAPSDEHQLKGTP